MSTTRGPRATAAGSPVAFDQIWRVDGVLTGHSAAPADGTGRDLRQFSDAARIWNARRDIAVLDRTDRGTP